MFQDFKRLGIVLYKVLSIREMFGDHPQPPKYQPTLEKPLRSKQHERGLCGAERFGGQNVILQFEHVV